MKQQEATEWKTNRDRTAFASPSVDSSPNQIRVFPGSFADGSITATITATAGQLDPSFSQGWRECSLVLRLQDNGNYYFGGIGGFGKEFVIAAASTSGWRMLADRGSVTEVTYDRPYHLKFECVGNRLTLFENNVAILEATDNGFTAGECGLRVNRTEARFDRVLVNGAQPKLPVNVVISYSHSDWRFLNRLQVHLTPLARQVEIELWDDTKIAAGMNWREAIDEAIRGAGIAILLISANYLASPFIAANELPPLLAAADSRGALIIPVILNHSSFLDMPELNQFQAINNPAAPLATLPTEKREEVYAKVANRVRAHLNSAQPAD